MNFTNVFSILSEKLFDWYEAIVSAIPNLLLAILIMVIFGFLSKKIGGLMKRWLPERKLGHSMVSLASQVTKIVVILVGLFIALGVMNLDKTVTSLLAGAGIIGLALGFAFQDLTSNFISGVFIATARPLSVGDVVETNGFFGKVKEIKIRSVIIDNFGGQEIEIPCKDIFQNPIMNYSKSGMRRMQLNCGVSYSTHLQTAQNVAKQSIDALPFIDRSRDVEVHFEEFGDSSINFKIWFWIDQDKAGPPLAMSEAVKALKSAFDNAGINIPFPIRTLELMNKTELIDAFGTNGHSH